jgi:hypothetical protein
MEYGTLPACVDQEAVRPFTVNILDEDLARMKALLSLSRIPGPCYENTLPYGNRALRRRNLGFRTFRCCANAKEVDRDVGELWCIGRTTRRAAILLPWRNRERFWRTSKSLSACSEFVALDSYFPSSRA